MSVGVGCEGGRGSIIEKPAVFDIHRIILGRRGAMRPNTIQLGRGIVSSSLGTALASFVWLSSCTSYVAVKRVDGRMRWTTVSWNWLEGLKLDFSTATGPALMDVPFDKGYGSGAKVTGSFDRSP